MPGDDDLMDAGLGLWVRVRTNTSLHITTIIFPDKKCNESLQACHHRSP
jgi:hypothetical protein